MTWVRDVERNVANQELSHLGNNEAERTLLHRICSSEVIRQICIRRLLTTALLVPLMLSV